MEYELTKEDLDYYTKFAKRFALRYYEKFYLNAIISLEDLIQEGMLGLLDAVGRYDPERDVTFRPYAQMRIAGSIIDFIRREFPYLALTHALSEDEEEVKLSRIPNTNSLSSMETRLIIKDVFNSLEDGDKLILYLLYFGDLSIREVGSITDIPKSTIHTTHKTILAKIQEKLNLSNKAQ